MAPPLEEKKTLQTPVDDLNWYQRANIHVEEDLRDILLYLLKVTVYQFKSFMTYFLFFEDNHRYNYSHIFFIFIDQY